MPSTPPPQPLEPSPNGPLILPLDRVAKDQRGLVGGKAANLAVLVHERLPVPPGFCVTTVAFAQFLQACPEGPELFRSLRRLPAATPDPISQARERGVARLAQLPIPPRVEQAILDAWRAQGESRQYAVRSSATLEDASDHSFAGQFESRLNVQGREALLAAIKQCWLSFFSTRALAYQFKDGQPIPDAAMAVLVQEMVPAETAGVLFTLDPVTGDTGRMVIEGAPGLGDRLVSGRLNPERVVLEKAALRVIAHSPADPPCLDEALARRLGKLAVKIERLFACPQDIEWAMAGGRVFLLQARTVTAARRTRPWEDRQVWSNLNSGEVAPDVMTPATWSVIGLFLNQIARSSFRLAGADLARAPLVGLVAGRIYFNLNTALATAKPFPQALLRVPRLTDALGGAPVAGERGGLPPIPDEDLPDLGFRWPRYLLSLPGILRELLAHSPRRGDAWAARLKARNDTGSHEDFAALSTPTLARRLGQLLHQGFQGWDLLYLGTQAVALVVFQKACRDWLCDPDLTLGYRLFAGLGGLPEAEAGLALWRLAALAHADPQTKAAVLHAPAWPEVRARLELAEPGRAFLAAWDAFMAEHGHHCRGELELFNPRWSERPDYIFGLARGYLRAIGQTDPLENQRRLAREREQLTGQCRQRLRNPLKRWIFSRALRRAQKLAINREEWKNQAVRQLTTLRRVLLALGERLAREGVLAQADDVFFLEVTETISLATGQAHFDHLALIRQRRAEYEMNLTLTPPPVVVGRFDANTPAAPTPDAGATTLQGIPVFPGVVTGPARVILRADDHEQVRPGEILVAPFTDPAWTPYFVTAAGLVVDQGGILSHGSIVAREYGLPAVTNVGSATRDIRTGDLIQLDGTRGRVTLMKRAVATTPFPKLTPSG